jgi:hypothetical protein
MFRFRRVLAGATVGLLAAVAVLPANAALIGVTKSFSDVSLSASTLIYDANGIDANTGLLRVVSTASTLNASALAASTAQSYLGAGDSVADVMLSFAINNTTGALVANSTFNKVSIGFGNFAVANPANFGFSWQGNIFAFGANATGTAFDARWSMTTDQYQNLGLGLTGAAGLFANGALAGMPGGMIITNTIAIGGANIWAFDWVRGQFAGTSGTAYAVQIAPYTTALLTTADRLSSTVVADIFVPLPAAAWFMFSGLIALVPAVRRRLAQA